MDLNDFEHTKQSFVKKVYKLYLRGYTIEDIRIITKTDDKTINNIIDCCNYLWN